MFDHFPEVEELYLTWNQLSGPIPFSLFYCQKLSVLSLPNNRFQGTIPAEIGNLTMLNTLYLGVNNFQCPTLALLLKIVRVTICDC